MKKRKKVALLAAFGLFLIGTVGAGAFLFKEDTTTIEPKDADTAVILRFGESNFTGIDNLTPGAPQYRHVGLKRPVKSTGFAKIPAFIVTYENSVAGVSISVSDQEWGKHTDTPFVKTITSSKVKETIVLDWAGITGDDTTYYLCFSITENSYTNIVNNPEHNKELGQIKLEYRALGA